MSSTSSTPPSPSSAAPSSSTSPSSASSSSSSPSSKCHFTTLHCLRCDRLGHPAPRRLRTVCVSPAGLVHPGIYTPNLCGTCHGPFDVRYRPEGIRVDRCGECCCDADARKRGIRGGVGRLLKKMRRRRGDKKEAVTSVPASSPASTLTMAPTLAPMPTPALKKTSILGRPKGKSVVFVEDGVEYVGEKV